MAGEWVRRKIGLLGRVVTGKTPATADPANFGGEYRFITVPDRAPFAYGRESHRAEESQKVTRVLPIISCVYFRANTPTPVLVLSQTSIE